MPPYNKSNNKSKKKKKRATRRRGGGNLGQKNPLRNRVIYLKSIANWELGEGRRMRSRLPTVSIDPTPTEHYIEALKKTKTYILLFDLKVQIVDGRNESAIPTDLIVGELIRRTKEDNEEYKDKDEEILILEILDFYSKNLKLIDVNRGELIDLLNEKIKYDN